MDDSSNRPTLHKNIQEVNTNMLDGLGRLAAYFGFNKVMGQLYGALLLSLEPLSLDDLMSQLGISKASVSTNMRTLERMGIAREVWVKDDRRKYYQAETDFWRILTNVLSSRELRDVNQALRALEQNTEHLEHAIPGLTDHERALADLYIERIEQLQDFFRLAQLLLLSIIEQAKDAIDASEIKRIEFE